MYKLSHLKKDELPVNVWSGGTTSELWIWPLGSHYGDRDFSCRISTATVDLLESDFTVLTGYTRQIMSLDNPLSLQHDQGKWIDLAPLTPHTFDGGAKTQSKGRVKDFNLMTRGSYQGKLEAVTLLAKEEKTIAFEGEFAFLLYGVLGQVNVKMENEEVVVSVGDCLILESENEATTLEKVVLKCEEESVVTIVTVKNS